MNGRWFFYSVVLSVSSPSLANPATEDLTPEEIAKIKDMYGGYAKLVDGVKLSEEGKAFLELYGAVRRLSSGMCVRSKVVRWAKMADGVLDIKPFNYPPSVTELLVWIPVDGEELDCSALNNTSAIKVNTPLEENTLLRLHDQGKALLSRGSALNKQLHIEKYTPDLRIDSIGINLDSFTYKISFMADECHGFSLDVVTNESGKFEPVNVVPIVC